MWSSTIEGDKMDMVEVAVKVEVGEGRCASILGDKGKKRSVK